MYIHEAIKKALAENKCITTPYEGRVYFKIKPTNNPEDNCILIRADGTPAPKQIDGLSHGWQPNAEALISDKWIVID